MLQTGAALTANGALSRRQPSTASLQAMLLAATLMIGHALSRAVGGLLLSPLFDAHGTYSTYMGFSKQFFFLAILPPIIFEAGWR